MSRVLAVVNHKGGTGKTVSAVHVAGGFARRGHRVVFVDADVSRADMSATVWAERGEFPFTMLGGLLPDVHRRLPGSPVARDADLVVIDTPPIEDRDGGGRGAAGVVRSALRAADVVLVPLAPTAADMEALPGLWAALEDVAEPGEPGPLVAVLFTSAPTNPRTASPRIYRQTLSQAGRFVLTTQIPFGERYAQAQAFALPRRLGAYEHVVDELVTALDEQDKGVRVS